MRNSSFWREVQRDLEREVGADTETAGVQAAGKGPLVAHRCFEPQGVDVRVIAATNRDLKARSRAADSVATSTTG